MNNIARAVSALLLACLAACASEATPAPPVTHAQPAVCTQYSQHLTESQLFQGSPSPNDYPVVLSAPPSESFVSLSVTNDLTTTPVAVWPTNLPKDRTMIDSNTSDSWSLTPSVPEIDVQQTLDNYVTGTGVQVDGTVCSDPTS